MNLKQKCKRTEQWDEHTGINKPLRVYREIYPRVCQLTGVSLNLSSYCIILPFKCTYIYIYILKEHDHKMSTVLISFIYLFKDFFFFFPIYFYQLEANYFTILWWFLPYIDMNQPWFYMYSPSQSPLPPPSLPDPSGSSQCTRPKHLSHASNLGW